MKYKLSNTTTKKVKFVGLVQKKPKRKKLSTTGESYTSFTVLVNTDDDTTKKYHITCFGTLADSVFKNPKKGKVAKVYGKLARNNDKSKTTYVVGYMVEFFNGMNTKVCNS